MAAGESGLNCMYRHRLIFPRTAYPALYIVKRQDIKVTSNVHLVFRLTFNLSKPSSFFTYHQV